MNVPHRTCRVVGSADVLDLSVTMPTGKPVPSLLPPNCAQWACREDHAGIHRHGLDSPDGREQCLTSLTGADGHGNQPLARSVRPSNRSAIRWRRAQPHPTLPNNRYRPSSGVTRPGPVPKLRVKQASQSTVFKHRKSLRHPGIPGLANLLPLPWDMAGLPDKGKPAASQTTSKRTRQKRDKTNG